MNVIAKKIEMRNAGRSPIPDVERLGEYTAREIESALRPMLSAQVAGMVMDSEIIPLSDFVDQIQAPSLIGVLSFPGANYKAIVNISSELIYHVVDLRMGGDPAVCPMPTTRSLTAIDFALCEQTVKIAIASFEKAIERMMDGSLGYHFQKEDLKQNVASVVAAPDTADVLRYTVSLDIGVAARSGDIDIVVPLSVLDVVRSAVVLKRPDTDVAIRDIWLERMRRAAKEAEIPLTAVLDKPQLSAETLENLEVGQVIPITSDAPQQIKLVMSEGTKSAFNVTTARLGSFEGKKMLKLNGPAEPKVIRHVLDAVQQEQ